MVVVPRSKYHFSQGLESPFAELRPSDYPRQVHVNEILNDGDYLDWLQERENLLFAKNKIGIVDGTLEKPEKSHQNHMAVLRCDAIIKGWLTAAMEKEIRVSVKYAKSAQEMWNDLQERFGKENAPKAYEIKQLLSNTKQDRASVSTYYARLRMFWDEMSSVFSTHICSCKGCVCDMRKKFSDQKDKEKLFEFLLRFDNGFLII
ncbi:uncharacterized protein LOC143605039 [Bidens hawaiensis]|uniref:uncharacterized protein LOC143605039 n=1 Tax=Bidens hawaiensis TaxID=980011 RepID=UPI004049B5DB